MHPRSQNFRSESQPRQPQVPNSTKGCPLDQHLVWNVHLYMSSFCSVFLYLSRVCANNLNTTIGLSTSLFFYLQLECYQLKCDVITSSKLRLPPLLSKWLFAHVQTYHRLIPDKCRVNVNTVSVSPVSYFSNQDRQPLTSKANVFIWLHRLHKKYNAGT